MPVGLNEVIIMKGRLRNAALIGALFLSLNGHAAVHKSGGGGLSENPVISVIEQNLAAQQQAPAVTIASRRYGGSIIAQAGSVLEPGDHLLSRGGVRLQLLCGEGSRISLSGTFSVQVLSTDNGDCAFEVSAGSLVAEASGAVQLRSGNGVMSFDHAIAAVQMFGSGSAQQRRWAVYQGQAGLQLPNGAFDLATGGQVIESAQGELKTGVLSAADKARAANVLARLQAVGASAGLIDQDQLARRYATGRDGYLNAFGRETASTDATGQLVADQQLEIESAADVDALLSSRPADTDLAISSIAAHREAVELSSQGQFIGTSTLTDVQTPVVPGPIPEGAITRDF